MKCINSDSVCDYKGSNVPVRSHRVRILLRVLRIASRTYLRLRVAISGPRPSPVSSQRAFCVARATAIAEFLKLITRSYKDTAFSDLKNQEETPIITLALKCFTVLLKIHSYLIGRPVKIFDRLPDLTLSRKKLFPQNAVTKISRINA